MKQAYIVISEYNDRLSKRQPWYTVKQLKFDLELQGYKVSVVEKTPISSKGDIVFKIFSLKDILKPRTVNIPMDGDFYYLITFPFYKLKDFIKLDIKTIFGNFKALKRILIMALVPQKIIVSSLRDSRGVVCISDRSHQFLSPVKPMLYYPFSKDNWGEEYSRYERKHTLAENKRITIGYFGPPYLTRYFKEIIEFFSWCHEHKANHIKTKVITRIDRNSSSSISKKYLKNIESYDDCKIINGFLSRTELLDELRNIDVLILPFKVVMSELPIVVLEALELNIPVITTNESGIHLLAQDCDGFHVIKDFNKCDYKEIYYHIGKLVTEDVDFDSIYKRIKHINEDTLRKICQK